MVSFPRSVSLVLVALLLGCPRIESYFTLFDSLPTSGWIKHPTWWNGRLGSWYSCGDSKVEYEPRILSMTLARPYKGASSMTENPNALLTILLRYEDAPRVECAVGDVRIALASKEESIGPADAWFWRRGEKQYECFYRFDVIQISVRDFSIEISPEKLGCSVPVLRLKRDTSYTVERMRS
jgi:hypothetical protein